MKTVVTLPNRAGHATRHVLYFIVNKGYGRTLLVPYYKCTVTHKVRQYGGPLEITKEELDPELVKMQFQVAVVNIGYHAADYFRKHPGRFISAHLADWDPETKEEIRFFGADLYQSKSISS